MNIICGIFGHKKGKIYSVFNNDREHLARCKRCGKMVLFTNEEHPGWTVW